MATMLRGRKDALVKRLLKALEAYEAAYPQAQASLYRRNPGAVYVRVIDDRFHSLEPWDRHERVWKFLTERVAEDEMGEVALLLTLTHAELATSPANMEHENPAPSLI
jgi:hypothetical protein